MTLVESLVQNLRRHVALGAHSSVGGDVHLIGVTEENTEGETAASMTSFIHPLSIFGGISSGLPLT